MSHTVPGPCSRLCPSIRERPSRPDSFLVDRGTPQLQRGQVATRWRHTQRVPLGELGLREPIPPWSQARAPLRARCAPLPLPPQTQVPGIRSWEPWGSPLGNTRQATPNACLVLQRGADGITASRRRGFPGPFYSVTQISAHTRGPKGRMNPVYPFSGCERAFPTYAV